jgi:hypothetical protein
MDPNTKHDFINNSLRLEVINKIICEAIHKGEVVEEELIKDLKESLNKHLESLSKF